MVGGYCWHAKGLAVRYSIAMGLPHQHIVKGDPSSTWTLESDSLLERLLELCVAVTGAIAQRRFSKLATFNVRTLTSRWRRLELASWAESHNCAAICIQEHRIYFQDSQNKIKREPLGVGWEFIYSSATTEGNHGVGFVVSPQTASALEDVTCISDRILRLKLRGRRPTSTLHMHPQLYPHVMKESPSSPIYRVTFSHCQLGT